MTPDDMIGLSRRAIACKGWRWLRGMLRQDDYRYVSSGVWARWSDVHSLATALHAPGQLPDLTDSATRGCLLTLVREAWSDPQMYVAGRGLWDVVSNLSDEEVTLGARSEAEALVSALEAAP